MDEKRYFTLEEANEQIPRLQATFGRVMQVRSQLKNLYKRLEAQGFAPEGDEFAIAIPGAPPDVVRDRATFRALLETLKEDLDAIHASGCLIKDIEIGLVDFLAKKDGAEIFLCWRYGEPEVAWWHPVEAGFAGRRPVTEL